MNIKLQQAARDYLGTDPAEWIEASRSISLRIARHISTNEGLSESALDSLREEVEAVLLSPTTVTTIATCSRPETAKKYLAIALRSGLEESGLEKEESYSSDWDIMDIGWDRDEFLLFSERWDGYEYHTGAPLLSVRGRYRTPLSEDIIEKLVASAIRSTTSLEKSPAQHGLFFLGSFDLALYHALQEHPSLLKTLDWRVFEELLADILSTFGYEVEMQKGTKDGGVDIFAVSNTGHFGKQRYLLQAKRWANRVGVNPVRELLFLQQHYGATKSCLATTSLFTQGAWRLAEQYRWQLSLRDYFGIKEWLGEAAVIKGQCG